MREGEKGLGRRGLPSASLGSVAVRRNLTDQVTDALRALVVKRDFRGERLPTENELAEHFGVSRTVVREAVARLKSSGLVESKQGSGLFVREPNAEMLFRIDPDSLDANAKSVFSVVELRRGVEVEAAALAAERRTTAQLAEIRAALAGITRAEAAGQDGVEADMEFHRAIVRATGNPHYLALWNFIGQFVRGAMRTTRANEARRVDFAVQVRAEHRAIMESIARGRAAEARLAALRHSEMAVARLRETRLTLDTAARGPSRRRRTGSSRRGPASGL